MCLNKISVVKKNTAASYALPSETHKTVPERNYSVVYHSVTFMTKRKNKVIKHCMNTPAPFPCAVFLNTQSHFCISVAWTNKAIYFPPPSYFLSSRQQRSVLLMVLVFEFIWVCSGVMAEMCFWLADSYRSWLLQS